MTDSLIVARALLRLGPFARAVSPEGCGRSVADVVQQRRERAARQRCVQSQDPWRAGAARAAFAIWATTDAPADKPRR